MARIGYQCKHCKRFTEYLFYCTDCSKSHGPRHCACGEASEYFRGAFANHCPSCRAGNGKSVNGGMEFNRKEADRQMGPAAKDGRIADRYPQQQQIGFNQEPAPQTTSNSVGTGDLFGHTKKVEMWVTKEGKTKKFIYNVRFKKTE